MKARYVVTITVPSDQCVTPNTVAHVLRAAADRMEQYQPDNEPMITGAPRSAGIPAWRISKQRKGL